MVEDAGHMKTIGLIGGMSWESTQTYYRRINELVQERLGGLHSARLVLYSVDFHEIERLQHEGLWDAAGELLGRAAQSLQAAGADFIVLCTNTMHRCAEPIAAAVTIPLLHIADATAQAIHAAGIARVGLLGTRFTMEQAFYRGRLEAAGIDTLVPEAGERAEVHRVIYDELCRGVVRADSRERYRRTMAGLVGRGAAGIVFGCTEIGLLVAAADAAVPVFDTADLHAVAAVKRALAAD
jgi:aspartate racemase